MTAKFGRDQRGGGKSVVPPWLARPPRPRPMDQDEVLPFLQAATGRDVALRWVTTGKVPAENGAGARYSTLDVGAELQERGLLLVVATLDELTVCHMVSEWALTAWRDPWRTVAEALRDTLNRASRQALDRSV